MLFCYPAYNFPPSPPATYVYNLLRLRPPPGFAVCHRGSIPEAVGALDIDLRANAQPPQAIRPHRYVWDFS